MLTLIAWLLDIPWVGRLWDAWEEAKREGEDERFKDMCRWFDEGRRGR